MTELEYFRLLAPEFSSVQDATVNQWLTVAANSVVTSCLGAEQASMARALYAAHMLSLTLRSTSGAGAALGAVLREREGDLERTYAAAKGGDTLLGSTTYGQQYIDITRACVGAAIMTRGCHV